MSGAEEKAFEICPKPFVLKTSNIRELPPDGRPKAGPLDLTLSFRKCFFGLFTVGLPSFSVQIQYEPRVCQQMPLTLSSVMGCLAYLGRAGVINTPDYGARQISRAGYSITS